MPPTTLNSEEPEDPAPARSRWAKEEAPPVHLVQAGQPRNLIIYVVVF